MIHTLEKCNFGFVVCFFIRSRKLLECFLTTTTTTKFQQSKRSRRATLAFSAKLLSQFVASQTLSG